MRKKEDTFGVRVRLIGYAEDKQEEQQTLVGTGLVNDGQEYDDIENQEEDSEVKYADARVRKPQDQPGTQTVEAKVKDHAPRPNSAASNGWRAISSARSIHNAAIPKPIPRNAGIWSTFSR
jgi:hypothetical protein